MSQKSLETFPELILPLDSITSEAFIGSAGSIDSANFIESAGSIDLANFSKSEEIIGPEAFIKSEGFFSSEGFLDSELSSSQEDPLALQYFESTGNPIFFQKTNLEDSLTSRNPISLQERTAFDPLTGMANNPIFGNIFNGSSVNRLSQARLDINLSTGTPSQALVTTTVKVELSPLAKFLTYFGLVNFTLQSNIWGIDGPGWFQGGADDYLFGFSDQQVTGDGTYSFSKMVDRGELNEDTIWPGNYDDEIQGRFKLVSSDNLFSLNLEARSGIITGRYY